MNKVDFLRFFKFLSPIFFFFWENASHFKKKREEKKKINYADLHYYVILLPYLFLKSEFLLSLTLPTNNLSNIAGKWTKSNNLARSDY